MQIFVGFGSKSFSWKTLCSPCSPGFYHSAAVPWLELILAKEPLLRLPLGLLIERIHDY